MHVIFAVNDVARSGAFYERVFGWPRNDGIDYSNDVELQPPERAAWFADPDGNVVAVAQSDGD